MKNSFNLLKEQIEPPTIWTKVYDWIVGTARLLVIFVEIIVVGAFAIRMVLDIQSTQLDKEIETQEKLMLSYKSYEDRYRGIQAKTSAFRQSWEGSLIFSDAYSEINSYIPVSAEELSISFSGTSVTVSGKAKASEISRMEILFKDSTTFISTELRNIESQGAQSEELSEFSLNTQIRNPTYRIIE